MYNLSECKKNVFSQNGEDEIIEKILNQIPDRDYWCCEFGAWDGIKYSNTRNLILNYGYKAVLIEQDYDKFKELEKNNNPKITTGINIKVGVHENTIDSILNITNIPYQFDFISIDVDGDDYAIWESMGNKTKIVCVEYNRTIPDGLKYVQPYGDFTGNSFDAFIELAKEKDYFLIACTLTNLFFVDNEYKKYFDNYEQNINKLKVNQNCISYMFEDYSGNYKYIKGGKCW